MQVNSRCGIIADILTRRFSQDRLSPAGLHLTTRFWECNFAAIFAKKIVPPAVMVYFERDSRFPTIVGLWLSTAAREFHLSHLLQKSLAKFHLTAESLRRVL